MSQDLPPLAMLVSHGIADYAKWKAVFDGHQEARKQASCLGHHILRGVDDPNRVTIYCLATDLNRVKAFLESSDLAEAMSESGVQGPPTVTLMRPSVRAFDLDKKLAGVIVRHRVEDYDTWRAVYDSFDAARTRAGIGGHAVSRDLENPSRVIVYHQADEVATLREFMKSPELREAMQKAGVTGATDIQFVETTELVEY